jgi:hypothetical protein
LLWQLNCLKNGEVFGQMVLVAPIVLSHHEHIGRTSAERWSLITPHRAARDQSYNFSKWMFNAKLVSQRRTVLASVRIGFGTGLAKDQTDPEQSVIA